MKDWLLCRRVLARAFEQPESGPEVAAAWWSRARPGVRLWKACRTLANAVVEAFGWHESSITAVCHADKPTFAAAPGVQ